jgi:hypothetical protein
MNPHKTITLSLLAIALSLGGCQHPRLKHEGFVPPLQVADQLKP